ncbi:MAG: O-antigen ligase family protein [Armatimonadota bacterium]|nr:O-antigen ligase family protein [Armatimonadota bacterium]
MEPHGHRTGHADVTTAAVTAPSGPFPHGSPPAAPAGGWSSARDAILCATAALLSPGYALVGAVLLFVVLVFEAIACRRNPWEPTPIDPLIVVWIGAVTASALMSDHRTLAVLNSALLALGIMLGCAPMTRTLHERPRFVRALYTWWVAGGAVAGVMAIVHFARGGTGGRGELPQLGFNATGTVLLIASLLALTLLVTGRGRTTYLAAAAQLPILAGLASTMSRGAWLGWWVGVFTLLVMARVGTPSMRRRAWAAAGVLAAAVLVAVAAHPDLLRRARSTLTAEVNRDRLLLWQASWRMFADHPWWGVGFGAFVHVFPGYRLPGDPNEFPPFAHNLLLSMAVETGAPAAAAFLALIVAIAWVGASRSLRGPPEHGMLRAGATAAFAGVMGHQMVDGTLQAFHLGFAFWFLVAVMVAPPDRAPQEASSQNAVDLRPTNPPR